MEPFIGQVMLFAGNFAPRYWAFCDGQLLSISENTALFSILGTTYGGDGRTSFGLPDLRGRVPIHPGNGPGLSPHRPGDKSGSETTTLTVANLPSHAHQIKVSNKKSMPATSAARGSEAAEDSVEFSPLPTVDMTKNTEAAGGGQAFNNMQPYACINYIIALQGIYPSRS